VAPVELTAQQHHNDLARVNADHFFIDLKNGKGEHMTARVSQICYIRRERVPDSITVLVPRESA
jgi:hypothetical protein